MKHLIEKYLLYRLEHYPLDSVGMAKISILINERIIEKISNERRAYESVDGIGDYLRLYPEKSKEKNSGTNGLIIFCDWCKVYALKHYKNMQLFAHVVILFPYNDIFAIENLISLVVGRCCIVSLVLGRCYIFSLVVGRCYIVSLIVGRCNFMHSPGGVHLLLGTTARASPVLPSGSNHGGLQCCLKNK